MQAIAEFAEVHHSTVSRLIKEPKNRHGHWMQGVIIWFIWHFGSHVVTLLVISDFPEGQMNRNYSAPLGFCSLARRRMRRIRSIWFICENSSIAATSLEGKRRGVLSSYIAFIFTGDIFTIRRLN